ncbi:MAG: radical SAM protein [Polyangiaceae bacterium]|nr:radical SAM protein [Polyangiaceae bacterium]
MRYQGRIFRPPSEADSLILQATLGCSWNHCTYCDMYRDRRYAERPLEELLADVTLAASSFGREIEKVFVADGDALGMSVDRWSRLLAACRASFPRLRRVSAYATARNVAGKSDDELRRLRQDGLGLVYVGPETGDPETFRRIAKGAGYEEHAEAARRAHAAGFQLSAIFLLGAGGVERGAEHAAGSARLATEMDPEFLSLLTLTVVPGTPIAKLAATGRFRLPSVEGTLRELRTFVAEVRPTAAVFRTNHASNYLPIAGTLPRDRDRILAVVDRALEGGVRLRPEWTRGL